MIDMINGNAETITLIGIGPLTNIAEALRRDPGIAKKTRFVAMLGSIGKNYEGNDGIDPEWNVRADIPASKAVFSASWKEAIITPVDTCGIVRLKGEQYARIKNANNKGLHAVLEAYRIWEKNPEKRKSEIESTILFDTVAVHLAFSTDFLEMEQMNIVVDNEGYTRLSPEGMPINVAIRWKDRVAYEEYLSRRLTNKVAQEQT
jgi:inosine-uridine nucleoside N-ribohydrolase